MCMALAEGALRDVVQTSVVRVAADWRAGRFEHYAVNRKKIASLTVHGIESDPVTISRLPEHIAADRVFDVLLHIQLAGTAEITQDGRSFTLPEGALAIVPGGVPYTVNYPEKGRKIIVRIPYRVFHERLLGREVRDFTASAFGSDGLVPIVVSLIMSLSIEDRPGLNDIEQFTVAESLLSLISLIIRSRSKSGARDSESSQSTRLCRILSYLEENFSDHQLTPTRIAEANFVSVRHLHGLFQQCGTTVSKWLWDRRLKAGREDLLDSAKFSMTVCEIAYGRGFNDSAHFSRAFKDRFGISPGQLRNKARTGVPIDA